MRDRRNWLSSSGLTASAPTACYVVRANGLSQSLRTSRSFSERTSGAVIIAACGEGISIYLQSALRLTSFAIRGNEPSGGLPVQKMYVRWILSASEFPSIAGSVNVRRGCAVSFERSHSTSFPSVTPRVSLLGSNAGIFQPSPSTLARSRNITRKRSTCKSNKDFPCSGTNASR